MEVFPLLSLPIEVTTQILISFIPPPEPIPQCKQPFNLWARHQNRHNDHLETIRNVSLTCKRLHEIVTSVLYRDLPLTLWAGKGHQRLPLLLRSLKENSSLRTHIRSSTIRSFNTPMTIEVLETFFDAPNMTSLALQGGGWNLHMVQMNCPFGTSEIKHLYLSACSIGGELASKLIAWPRALQSLHIEIDQPVWTTNWGGGLHPKTRFSVAPLVSALQSQKHSLETLVVTRTSLSTDSDRLPTSDLENCFNIRNFTSLRTLCILYEYLIYYDRNNKSYAPNPRLPVSLQHLEIAYDSTFVAPHDIFDNGRWIFHLLDRSSGHLPVLKTIRIISFAFQSSHHPSGFWINNLHNVEILDACTNSGVSLSIWLNQNARLKTVLDGNDYQDDWEDSFQISRHHHLSYPWSYYTPDPPDDTRNPTDLLLQSLDRGSPSQACLDAGATETCQESHPDILKALLSHGARISDEATNAAASRHHLEVFQVLFDYGWDFNSYASGSPPFNMIVNGFPAVKWFLDHGADPNLRGRNPACILTPLESALSSRRAPSIPIIDLLIRGGAEVSSTALRIAIEQETVSLDAMQYLLDRVVDINASAWLAGDRPLLHVAAHANNFEKVKLLLENGADPDALFEGHALFDGDEDSELVVPCGDDIHELITDWGKF